MRPSPISIPLRAVFALTLLVSTTSFAHHSYAMFDMKKEIVVEGTVKNFQWTNPHIWIDVVVMEKGKPVNWSIEGKGPIQLLADGWHRNSIKTGDKVSMVIHPLRKGTNGGSLLKILVNGKEINVPK
jgi:hypothetical protein